MLTSPAMHPKRITKYVDQLNEIVSGATTSFSDPKPIPRPRTDGSRSYALSRLFLNSQRNLVDTLLKNEKWITKFSQTFLENRISSIVSAHVGSADSSGLDLAFRDLVHEFESLSKPVKVIIPLVGLRLDNAELVLGKIRLVTPGAEYLESLRFDARKISASLVGDEKVKTQGLNSVLSMIEDLRDCVCAERMVVAEPQRAREIALEDIRLTIALFNFLADALTYKFQEIRVGLKGEFAPGRRVELTCGEDFFNWSQPRLGPRLPLVINEEALKLMNELDLFALIELVTSDDFKIKGTFEGLILTAIHFHSHARELSDSTDKVLTLMTAIEQFFETTQKAIADTVANGCALVLCLDLEHRKKLKRLMKERYKLRSSVSHHGQRSVLETELEELAMISWHLIAFAIKERGRFSDKNAFNSWVEDLGLGLPGENDIIRVRE